jgi:hypothetical protein
MPTLSRLFVRAALAYLALGFTLGGLLLAAKAWPLPGWTWRLLPAHVEFLLVGWTLQLALGVAFWILPRFAAPGPRGRAAPPPSRGDERPAWLAYVLLNAGVWAVGAAPWAGAPLALAGRSAELAGAAAFAVHAWPRVKAVST